MQTFSKILRYSIFAGIFSIPFLVLVVAPNLFFPFITGKNFLFRSIVEIIFGLWLILAYVDKSYRPQRSFILLAAAALLFILTLSTIFGENVYRSFWSNFERMEGLVTHFHLFAYFLVLASFLKKEKEWFWFFHTSIGASLIVSFYGLLQYFGKLAIHQGTSRLDATLGNATYLAIYLVFHLFLISFYFFRAKKMWLRILYASFFAFEFAILYHTGTRGAFLGFFIGVIIMAAVISFLARGKARYFGIGAIVLLFFLAGIFLLAKDTNFIKQTPMLSRFSELFVTDKTTSEYKIVRARFTIWKLGWEGFKERPVLGWGPENFNLVFNKYYQPKLYRQEPWFDRSHNIIFDWLVSTGALGFLIYLSLGLFVIWYSWRNYRRQIFSIMDASIITSLVIAYFFHNLFVFDNVTSYILFFAILAFMHSCSAQGVGKAQIFSFDPNKASSVIMPASFVMIGFVFVFYFVNVVPYLVGKTLIGALKAVNAGDLNLAFENFDRVFKYNSFGTTEAREQFAQLTNQALRSPQISQDAKDKFFLRAEDEFKKQLEEAPQDIRYYLFLGGLYDARKQYDNAISVLNKAVELSPKKQQIYFELGNVYLQKGDLQNAIPVLRKAYDLDPGYLQATLNLSTALILGGQKQEAIEILRTQTGSEIIQDPKFVQVYFMVKDFDRASQVMEKLIQAEPNNFDYRTMAASLYFTINQRQKAVESLEKAIELNPSFKEKGEFYIKEIKAGKTL